MAFVSCTFGVLRKPHTIQSISNSFRGIRVGQSRATGSNFSARFLATVTPPQAPKTAPTKDEESPTSSYTTEASPASFRLLWDSECPLCVKEIDFLKRRAQRVGASIDFVDIADESYDPSANSGIDYETAMGKIHAVKSDGKIVVGIEAFRASYEEVGLGWVYALTSLPGVNWLADRAYDFWAARRLRWTGRPELEEIMAARAKRTCRE